MKKLCLTTLCLLLLTCSMRAQRTVDAVFEKYADKDGYTTLNLNGNLLRFTGLFEEEYGDDGISGEITQVRILSHDNEDHEWEGFSNDLTDEVSTRGYEEFMSVRESDGDFRVLVKSRGGNLAELLLLAGGEDNLIIQVKGNISKKDARRISEHFRYDRSCHEHDEDN